MTDKSALKKTLPTGEEPPKGYETLVKDPDEKERIIVDFVMLNHLAKSERQEIEALRNKSLELVQHYIGLSNKPLSIEEEVCIIKDIEDENKMFARVYHRKKLVGYSLVVIGWPEQSQWLIQHMIIDPDMRGQGIGTAIVDGIERYAKENEVAADSIMAIPIQESGKSFWQERGYVVEAMRHHVTLADIDHELVVYHKAFNQ